MGELCAAELRHGDPPRLMPDDHGDHQRPARVRAEGRRRPAAGASGRHRMLAEKVEAAQPGHRLGGQAAGHRELAGGRRPLNAGLAVHRAQHRHGCRGSPPVRHRYHAAYFTRMPSIMWSVVTLLSLITVVSWGTWIPLAQAAPGVPQRTRILYVTLGNVMFAGAALVVAGGHLAWGWRSFWLPVAGGVVWTSGNYSAFRASEAIGLARAAGSWTPLNIIVAFVWGAALFGELDGLSSARFAVLGGALVLVVAGVLVIVRSQDAPPAGAPPPGARLAARRERSRVTASVSTAPTGAAAPARPAVRIAPAVPSGPAAAPLPVLRGAGQQ